MKRTFLLGSLPFIALIFCIVGCDDVYSESVHYNLRTDPVLLKKLGDEYPFPDPPGQLPILTIENFNDERNPYFAKDKGSDYLFKEGYFRDPNKVPEGERKQIKDVLDKLFGTPAKPTVGGIEEAKRQHVLDELQLKDETLAEGSKYYRVYCLHCHGVTGDGRGPTARWVNPHPRDYRHGRFKFLSVDQTKGTQTPPSRADLMRTLEVGLEGTAMPSFVLLPSPQREALVSYVIHLSLRGKAETDVFKFSINPDTNKLDLPEERTLEETITRFHNRNVTEWVQAQDESNRIPVRHYPYKDGDMVAFKASVERGRQIFIKPPAELNLGENVCITCHKDFGRQSTFRYDEWGTFAKPNNLLNGVYRGGRRPLDIYYRIHSGIQPSGMLAFGSVLKVDEKTKADPLWDLVNFVRVLGNPTMRQQMDIHVD